MKIINKKALYGGVVRDFKKLNWTSIFLTLHLMPADMISGSF